MDSLRAALSCASSKLAEENVIQIKTLTVQLMVDIESIELSDDVTVARVTPV